MWMIGYNVYDGNGADEDDCDGMKNIDISARLK